jgi:hypothetical protein
MICEICARHQIDVVAVDLDFGVSVKKDIGQRVHFALAEIAEAARVPNYIFHFQNVGVEQGKITNSGHRKLQGDLATTGPATGHEDARLAQRSHVEQRRKARKKPVIITHLISLPAWATARIAAKRRSAAAIGARVSALKMLCVFPDSSRS